MGAKKSAAHWGAYLVEQGIIDPKTVCKLECEAILELWIGCNQVMILDIMLLLWMSFKKEALMMLSKKLLDKIR